MQTISLVILKYIFVSEFNIEFINRNLFFYSTKEYCLPLSIHNELISKPKTGLNRLLADCFSISYFIAFFSFIDSSPKSITDLCCLFNAAALF